MKKIVLSVILFLLQILLIQLFLGYLLSLWRVAWLLNVDVPDWVDVQLIRVDGSHVIRHYDSPESNVPSGSWKARTHGSSSGRMYRHPSAPPDNAQSSLRENRRLLNYVPF